MGLMGIGEFARLSRLSPKALRLHDELGLLPPARVDPGSGYRWYAAGQLSQARLVASLRQIGVPLTQITRARRRSDFGGEGVSDRPDAGRICAPT
jgi:protein phosphatase